MHNEKINMRLQRRQTTLWKNKQDHIVLWLCGLISMCSCLFVLLIRGMWVKWREIIGEMLFLLRCCYCAAQLLCSLWCQWDNLVKVFNLFFLRLSLTLSSNEEVRRAVSVDAQAPWDWVMIG